MCSLQLFFTKRSSLSTILRFVSKAAFQRRSASSRVILLLSIDITVFTIVNYGHKDRNHSLSGQDYKTQISCWAFLRAQKIFHHTILSCTIESLLPIQTTNVLNEDETGSFSLPAANVCSLVECVLNTDYTDSSDASTMSLWLPLIARITRIL